jgi:hypothetical protein
MRTFAYWVGTVLVITGAAIAVADLLAYLAVPEADRLSLAVIWHRLHAGSLAALQELVQGLSGTLWTAMAYVLLLPAWLTLTLPGALLMLLNRRRRGGGYFD